MKKAFSVFKLEIAAFFKSAIIAIFSLGFLFVTVGISATVSSTIPLSYNPEPTEFASVEESYYSQMTLSYYQYQTAIGETPTDSSNGNMPYGDPKKADEYYQNYLYYKYLYDNHLVLGQDILIVSRGKNPLENWLSYNKDTIGTNNKYSLFSYNLTTYSSYLIIGFSVVITAYLFANKNKDAFEKNILMAKDMTQKDILKGKLITMATANLFVVALFTLIMILLSIPNIGITALVGVFNHVIAVPFILINLGSFVGYFVLSIFVSLFVVLLSRLFSKRRWAFIVTIFVYAISFVIYKAASSSVGGFDNQFNLSFFPLINLQFAINSVVNPAFYCLLIVYGGLSALLAAMILRPKKKRIAD